MINVIHYVDQPKALSEIFRILKPGGYLYIHFNLQIIGPDGMIDYQDSKPTILNRLKDYAVIQERTFTRRDTSPLEHTHTILELMLQKPMRRSKL